MPTGHLQYIEGADFWENSGLEKEYPKRERSSESSTRSTMKRTRNTLLIRKHHQEKQRCNICEIGKFSLSALKKQ